MFKLISLLLVITVVLAVFHTVESVVEDEVCFLNVNEFITTKKGYTKMELRFFQYPFLRPLNGQAPVCPKLDAQLDCTSDTVKRYRQPDGSCNNLIYKWWGSTHTPYQRLLAPNYSNNRNQFEPRLSTALRQPLPDSRLVANKIPLEIRHTGLNSWFTFFGQLVAHDLAHTARSAYAACSCDDVSSECFNIMIKAVNEDEIVQCEEAAGPSICRIDPIEQPCIPFPRSADVKEVMDCKFDSREQFSLGTHFLDLDNIYGASEQTEMNIRAYANGQLKVDLIQRDPAVEVFVHTLPILDINECIRKEISFPTGEGQTTPVSFKSKSCIYGGGSRANEHTFLSISHLLMHRVHNKISAGLQAVNPHWNDEALFQEARRILVAVYQNIVYAEYLEIAIGKDTMNQFNLNPMEMGYTYDYDAYLYPNNYNEFATAAFRLHHTTHTEITFLNSKFVLEKITVGIEEYEEMLLHELHFNSWLYYDQIDTLMFTFVGEGTYSAQFGLISTLNHLLPLNDDNKNTWRFSLGAANIQRGRDHGLPGYGDYAHMAGSPYPKVWDDLTGIFKQSTIDVLETLYDFPSDVDLWVGLIAEIPDQKHLLAKTQRWLIGKNFYNNKFGDRHYFENGQDHENRFSLDQLNNIRKIRFSSLMCMGFGDVTDGNKMPERGFFMPEELTVGMNIVAGCTNVRPENEIVACSGLATINFNLWDTTLNSKTYY